MSLINGLGGQTGDKNKEKICNNAENMKKKRKYIYLEKCLIIRILQIYIFSFYDFLFFISLSDPENEVLIKHALKELTRGKTVLKIAHRLSTVVDADRILVVDNGEIAEEGTHQELLAKKGIYAVMWNEYNRSASWTIGRKEDNNHD